MTTSAWNDANSPVEFLYSPFGVVMDTPFKQPLPDYTPEQKVAIYAKYKKLFTVEDLIGYIENTDPTFPAEQVLAEADEIVRAYELKKAKGPG